jgi:hypothetical protein
MQAGKLRQVVYKQYGVKHLIVGTTAALAAFVSGAPLHANALLWRRRAVVALPCALAGAIAWGSLTIRSAVDQERAAEHRLSLIQSVKPKESAPAAPASVDFATQLSAAPSSPRIIEVVHEAAQSFNAQLDAVLLQERPATSTRLAHTDASIELRSSYSSTKAATGAVLSRLPTATVTRMQWQADPGGTLVRVTANLSVWGAPLPSVAASVPR